MSERLYRSRDDRMLAGVAGGLAEMWDADPSLVRILWALLVLLTGGVALVVYIVMAIVVPEDPLPRAGGTMGAAGGVAPAAEGAAPAATGDTEASDPGAPATAGWVAPGATAGPGGAPASAAELREARRQARAQRRANRSGLPGGVIAGLVLIAIGAFFLARQFIPRLDFDWFWPLILIGIGALILVSTFGGGPRDPDAGT